MMLLIMAMMMIHVLLIQHTKTTHLSYLDHILSPSLLLLLRSNYILNLDRRRRKKKAICHAEQITSRGHIVE